MGSGGAVGLNYLAFERIAKVAGVDDSEILNFYAKMTFITSVLLDFQYRDMEERRKKESKK